MGTVADAYYRLLASIESGNNPFAKAARSTASGLYQFTKETWISMGGTWGNQSGQAFGGLSPSIEEQNTRVRALTEQNKSILERAGIAINNATLYAAHFLGAGGAKRILGADPDTPIEEVTTAAQRRANPSILKGTVGDFFAWLTGKTGTSPMPFSNSGSGAPNTGSDRPTLEGAPYVPPGTPGLGSWYTDDEIEEELGDRPIVTGPGFTESLNPFGWVKDIFTINNAARAIAVVLGVAFVIIAIIVLMNSDASPAAPVAA